MKVYDCFLYYDEVELLWLRCNELRNVVTHFVLCEATQDFRGKKKPLYFARKHEMFKEFPIRHLVLGDVNDAASFGRFKFEGKQRDTLIDGLYDAEDDDLIVLSDVDELWNPNIVKDFLERKFPEPIRRIRCRHYIYYMNWWISNRMNGPVITTMKHFRDHIGTMTKLREHRRHGRAISFGGWHFELVGGVDATTKKLNSMSHLEFNPTTDDMESFILNRKYYDERQRREIVQVEIDETFPKYLRENIRQFEMFIHD